MLKPLLYLFFGLIIASFTSMLYRTITRHPKYFALLSKLKMKKIDQLLSQNIPMGITKEKRSPKLIVSLTSFPERIKELHYCIYTLLTQSIKPDVLVLWLATEQFPNKENDLPKKLLQLKNSGLTIKWCSDIRSFKKLIPSLKEYPNDIIVTTDDDAFYPKNWLELLYTSYLTAPKQIHCHRAHRIKLDPSGDLFPYSKWQQNIDTSSSAYSNLFTGVGGVLYPPNSLYKDIYREDLFKKLCYSSDDLWFWAMGILNGTKICLVKNNIGWLLEIFPLKWAKNVKRTVLGEINITNKLNDTNMNNILSQYPQLKKILTSENFK